jgi:hypothetical protein
VLGYQRKTATTFEGLRRGLYGTSANARLRAGRPLTSFEAMLIPEDLREGLPLPPRGIRNIIKDEDSPLLMQRSSDLYVVVVRLPDPPHLRKSGDEIQLIPGENHWETAGYDLFRDGERITSSPIRPGTSMRLPGKGTYTAASVEWSGLEGKSSLPLELEETASLVALSDQPDDFSWTRNRRLVEGKEVSEEQAMRSDVAAGETVHLHDSVICRRQYRRGAVVEQHDFSLEQQAVRRLFYDQGRLTRREYHDRHGSHVSTELFGPDGRLTESIQHGSRPRHWSYEYGVPVKYARGSQTYVKEGTRWVKSE